jgi:GntR family transcriptional repressor for pyruvate dehydrogenase complex
VAKVMHTDLSSPPPADGFGAIHRPRVYEEVARRLQALIVDGQLKPGDRLPPERELVRQFQVSRGSVRDAIRVLEVMGLVRSRQGEGTAVRELSADALILPLATALARKRELVTELFDVRRMIEPPIAARAAVHATDEEIRRLEAILVRQRARMRRGEVTVEEDSEFHYTIALTSRHTVVRKVVDVLMDLLRESRARSLLVDGRQETSLTGHRRILRAIRRRDPRAAEKAMRLHLKQIGELVISPR